MHARECGFWPTLLPSLAKKKGRSWLAAPSSRDRGRRKLAPAGMAVPSHLPLTASGTAESTGFQISVWQTWRQLLAIRTPSEVAHRC